ncbi:hypothetical protein HMPREF3190_00447 [Umbribacter vaginalis]|nr:hypothetical protein HMPREF3190_00447 [Coriobacteriales bacterium DNF00809]
MPSPYFNNNFKLRTSLTKSKSHFYNDFKIPTAVTVSKSRLQ